MNRYTLLATTLLIPSLIHAMELAEYVTPENMTTHRRDVHALYASTYLMLADFQSDNKQSAKNLVNVIDQMNSLKLAQPPVREAEIGFFILKKNPPLSFVESLKKPFYFTPNPITASIFFSRLASYNDDIGKKAFVSPNAIQIGNHFRAQKINRTVEKNAERNIVIPQQAINENIIPTPGSVGVSEFAQLMHDIADILNGTPQDNKWSARLIYHNELNGKPSPVSQ